MANKRWILFPLAALLAATMLTVLAGCGGSTANVQNPPPPPPSQVTIAFESQPASPLAVSFSENLTATVTNDPNNYGVEWNLVCPANVGAGNCGTLCASANAGCSTSTAQTISCPTPPNAACTAIYTAPASISGGSIFVQIVAYAIANEAKNQVAEVQVTTFDGTFQAGNYVLQAQGVDTNNNPYQFAGVITLDSQGDVTGGELTVNSGGVSTAATINPQFSSYFLGSDGRGTINLSWTSIANAGVTGTEQFAFVFLNSSQNPQALISEIDNFSATGTMDLQQTGTIAAPVGSYAFVMMGDDVLALDTTPKGPPPLAFGGVFSIAASQNGHSSAITGVTDEIAADNVQVSDGSLAGSVLTSGPDTLGQVTLTLAGFLTASLNHPKPVSVGLTGYIVDPTHMKLIETDTAAGSVVPAFGTTVGLAIGQGAAAGTFTDQSFDGTYVFGVSGVDLYSNSSSGYIPSTLTAAGLLTSDGSGNLTSGFTDTFLQVNCVLETCKKASIQGAQISSSFTGTYSVDAPGGGLPDSGLGRATIGCTTCTPSTSVTFPASVSPTYRPEFFYYLTGLTGTDPAALVLTVGDVGADHNLHYPSLGTGLAYLQSGTLTFGVAPGGTDGLDYGFSFAQVSGSEGSEAPESVGVAEMTANPTANPNPPTGAVSGAAFSTTALPPASSLPANDYLFSGTFNPPQPNGIFAGTLANYNSLGAGNDGIAFTVGNNNNGNDTGNLFDVNYYIIDQDHGFWVETDLITGINPNSPSGQVSFGYYAARAPLCPGCP